MRRYYVDVWQRGDLKAAEELVRDDAVDHNPMPGQLPGRAGHDQAVQMIRQAFPDLEFTIDDLLAEGDRVVGRWTMHGTHRGEMMGVPATGKPVNVTGIDIVRWQDGKVAEVWHQEDILGMMQQVGVAPGPGQASA